MPASKIFLSVETDTKKEEKIIIDGFLQRLQYSSKSIIEREQPDFELNLKKKRIGVEITKYYSDYSARGSKTQQKISEWITFAKKLKSRVSDINGNLVYLYGAIHFRNDWTNYNELLKDNYWMELRKIIESVSLESGEEKTLEISKDNFPLLARHIISIYLRNTEPEKNYLWWESGLQSGQVIRNESALKFIAQKKRNSFCPL